MPSRRPSPRRSSATSRISRRSSTTSGTEVGLRAASGASLRLFSSSALGTGASLGAGGTGTDALEQGGGLGARTGVGLGEHPGDVHGDGALADVEALGDLAVGQAFGQDGEDLVLARGQRRQLGGSS